MPRQASFSMAGPKVPLGDLPSYEGQADYKDIDALKSC